MIKKALLATGASLIAFAIGLIGAFFLLPMVAPDFADELLNPPDSTAMSPDSLALADGDSLAQDPAQALLDSLAHDSTAVLDSTLLRALEPGMITIHEDSVANLRADLRDRMRTQELTSAIECARKKRWSKSWPRCAVKSSTCALVKMT